MSTSAVAPIAVINAASAVDYNGASASTAQQAVFSSIVNQLQVSVASGDLPSSRTLLEAVTSISPSASAGSTPLASFLSNLSGALGSGSISGAQAALSTYQQSAAGYTVSSSLPAATADVAAEAAQITVKIAKNSSQLFVDTHPRPSAAFDNQKETAAVQQSVTNLMQMLNAAYPTPGTHASAPSVSAPTAPAATSHITASRSASTTSPLNSANVSSAGGAQPASSSAFNSSYPSQPPASTPYDTLVASIQATLAGSRGTLTPALASLQVAGNFVNTSA